MDNKTKSSIISYSSAWVSALLNLIPGLGTGYIYQRRWRAYWVTLLVSLLWFIYTYYLDIYNDPSDPISNNVDQINFIGLIIIGLVTAVESAIAATKSPIKD